VRTQIVVEAPIDRAFQVFTEGFGAFKPPEHNLLGAEIAETVFEPRVGGHLYDRGVDGSECRWARVLAYEPPDRVVISWESARNGRSRPTSRRPARSRCGSSPRPPSERGSSSSTATSTATARAGRESATRSAPRAAAALPAAVRRAAEGLNATQHGRSRSSARALVWKAGRHRFLASKP
jgi:uncharacterized protein YndB with AHSA1/START domain